MRTPHPLARRLLVAALTIGAAACAATTPADAANWTEVATPSTATISNLEWRGAELFWTTANGRIYRREANGTITERYSTGGTPLTDIEFQPGGSVGFAVGTGGRVVRTGNGGVDWAPVTGITASNEGDGSGNKCTTAVPLTTDLNFVRWAGANRVFVGGSKRQLVVADDPAASQVGAVSGSWDDANRKQLLATGDNCRLDYVEPFIDLAPVSPSAFYTTNFAYAQYLGNYDDGQSESDERGFLANANRVGGRIAIDPDNPQRMWSVNGGASYGVSGAVVTENGWDGKDTITVAGGYPGDDSPWDVDYAGGTVLMVGSQGKVLTSVDGRNFVNLPAGGAIAGAEWHAVHLASPTVAAIGGTNGKLAITADANALPLPPVVTPPVTVPPTTPPPVGTKPPAATLPGSSKPPLVGGVALKGRKQVVLRVKGTLGVPKGVSRSAACRGRITVSVLKGRKTLKRKRIKLDAKCRYKGTIKVKRRKVGSATRLRLKVAFGGNSALSRVATTYGVKVKAAR